MVDRVEIIGGDRFAATAHRASRDLDALEAPNAGRTVALRGRTEAPRRTGRLAASVTAGGDSGDVIVYSRLIYAPVIHNGWAGHNISANPFLARALHDSKGDVTKEYTVAAQKTLGHVKGA